MQNRAQRRKISRFWSAGRSRLERYKIERQLRRYVRQYRSLGSGQLHLMDWDITFIDVGAAAQMIRIQVLDGYNDFVAQTDSPVILDCGANVGISVLRYKQLYPHAKVIAFEANHRICQVLRQNVAQNRLADVEVVEAAVWSETAMLSFDTAHDTQSGHLVDNSVQRLNGLQGDVVQVQAVWLGEYLSHPVDFIKMDIEGAELAVLQSCAPLLRNVREITIEVHYTVDRPNVLAALIQLLHETGFKVDIHVTFTNVFPGKPYKRPKKALYDQFPQLHGWR